ncbi:MAG: 30S ribosomal protein S6 [Myxococcota bacterium]
MREYETTIIVQPEISDEGTAAIFERLEGILADSGSIRLQNESLGKRKLAYEIRRFHKGHYYIYSFLSDGQVVRPLERALRLNESILRFMTILADPDVTDVEARKLEAAEAEAEQERKAQERAAREEEEAKAREDEEAKARADAERIAIETAAAATEEAAAASEEAGAAEEAGEEGGAAAEAVSEAAPEAVAEESAADDAAGDAETKEEGS